MILENKNYDEWHEQKKYNHGINCFFQKLIIMYTKNQNWNQINETNFLKVNLLQNFAKNVC